MGKLMKPTVYLDATIPSFYFEDRAGTITQAWREITVEFWDKARERYDCFLTRRDSQGVARHRLPQGETGQMPRARVRFTQVGDHC
jgi:hypothetical protein